MSGCGAEPGNELGAISAPKEKMITDPGELIRGRGGKASPPSRGEGETVKGFKKGGPAPKG